MGAPGGRITYADLQHLRYDGSLPNTVEAWDSLLEGIEVSSSDLNSQVQIPISQVWLGRAAQMAQDSVSTTQDGLQGSKQLIGQIADELRTFYSNLVKLSQSLTFVVEDPTAPHPPQPAPPGYMPISMTPPNLVDCFRVDSGGTVDLTSRVEILAAETGLSKATIDGLQNQFQGYINWYVTEANTLDEAAAAELARLMPKPVQPKPKPPTTIGGVKVTVQAWPDPTGSLWGIAQKVYGNGDMWPYIYEANKSNPNFPVNWNPNDIQVGWDIHVPPISVHAPVPAVPAVATSDDDSDA
jgi:hypothetical protein